MTPRRGFTLAELLVALAILGVMAGAAVPALAVWLDREPSPAEAVAALVREARAEALETGRPVVVYLHAPTGRWVSEREGRPTTEGVLPLAHATLPGADRVRLGFAPTGGVTGTPLAVREDGRVRVVRADRWTGEVTLHAP